MDLQASSCFPAVTRVVGFATLLLAVGCAYPRRSTPMSVVRDLADALDAPAFAHTFEVVSAEIPARNRGNLTWDEQDGLPDPYARIYRDDVLIFETDTLQDTLTPEWRAVMPRNFFMPPNARIRIEVWDRDSVGADPVGVYRQVGLPANAVAESSGGEARVVLEGGASFVFALRTPTGFRGIGIDQYEVHANHFLILAVQEHSPAGRADLLPGDLILAIGGSPIAALGEARGASALSLASDRGSVLQVRRGGMTREVELDRGYIWPTM